MLVVCAAKDWILAGRSLSSFDVVSVMRSLLSDANVYHCLMKLEMRAVSPWYASTIPAKMFRFFGSCVVDVTMMKLLA